MLARFALFGLCWAAVACNGHAGEQPSVPPASASSAPRPASARASAPATADPQASAVPAEPSPSGGSPAPLVQAEPPRPGKPLADEEAGSQTRNASLTMAPREVCPPEMALVDGRFCIDRWEATTATLDGKPHSPYLPVTHEKVRAESRPGEVPQAYLSMEEADQACSLAGKRLCTTQQWVDACMGAKKPKRSFPYGNVEQPTACNASRGDVHPLMALHSGKRPTDSFHMNDPRINQLPATVAPTGAFEACTTPDGVVDLVGNLLEWTRGERPLLMGGYYLDAQENGVGCAYVTLRHDEKYHDFSTGFRCCLEPSRAALRARETEIAEVSVTATAAGGTTPPATGRADAPQPASAAPAAPRAIAQAAAGMLRDPAEYRSFTDPGAKLPPMPAPPPYEPADAACPTGMLLVDGKRCNAPEEQCLRWLEVPGQEPQRSCAEFAPSVCKGGTRPMRFCIDEYEYTPEGWPLPLVNVSWGEAQNICKAMDKRLCVEDEWEFACEGPEALPYPYGTVRNGAACNHDLPDLFDPRQKLVDRRVPTDSLPQCKSPFGVFNLVGNVDEWTTRVNKDPPWRSILRGGWWLTGRNRCRAATESHNEIYAGAQTGFRCCKSARK